MCSRLLIRGLHLSRQKCDEREKALDQNDQHNLLFSFAQFVPFHFHFSYPLQISTMKLLRYGSFTFIKIKFYMNANLTEMMNVKNDVQTMQCFRCDRLTSAHKLLHLVLEGLQVLFRGDATHLLHLCSACWGTNIKRKRSRDKVKQGD